ncbi:hypothetical protein NLY39_07650 [Pseudomonas sp. KHPS1]|nr:hypothetical protein [Pseudomonas sp. KHPS1]UTH38015.1 hypothetical protein NLY39_07650 [Pseudomonas sp. KHPS1]
MNKWSCAPLIISALVCSQSVYAEIYKCSSSNGVTFQSTACDVKVVEKAEAKTLTDEELRDVIQAEYIAERNSRIEAEKARIIEDENRTDENGLNAEGRRRMADRIALVSACIKHQQDCTVQDVANAIKFMNLGQVEALLGKGKSKIRVVEYFDYNFSLKSGVNINHFTLEIFYQLPTASTPNDKRPVYEMRARGRR